MSMRIVFASAVYVLAVSCSVAAQENATGAGKVEIGLNPIGGTFFVAGAILCAKTGLPQKTQRITEATMHQK